MFFVDVFPHVFVASCLRQRPGCVVCGVGNSDSVPLCPADCDGTKNCAFAATHVPAMLFRGLFATATVHCHCNKDVLLTDLQEHLTNACAHFSHVGCDYSSVQIDEHCTMSCSWRGPGHLLQTHLQTCKVAAAACEVYDVTPRSGTQTLSTCVTSVSDGHLQATPLQEYFVIDQASSTSEHTGGFLPYTDGQPAHLSTCVTDADSSASNDSGTEALTTDSEASKRPLSKRRKRRLAGSSALSSREAASTLRHYKRPRATKK